MVMREEFKNLRVILVERQPVGFVRSGVAGAGSGAMAAPVLGPGSRHDLVPWKGSIDDAVFPSYFLPPQQDRKQFFWSGQMGQIAWGNGGVGAHSFGKRQGAFRVGKSHANVPATPSL
jgi:hypothetical protein